MQRAATDDTADFQVWKSAARDAHLFTSNVISGFGETNVEAATAAQALNESSTLVPPSELQRKAAELAAQQGGLSATTTTANKGDGAAAAAAVLPPKKVTPSLSELEQMRSEHQRTVPRLPVPALQETMDLYLKSIEGLATAEEYERVQIAVDDFLTPGGRGEYLQSLLLERERRADAPSWLEEWWDDGYLTTRDPIPINVNYFFSLAKHKDPTKMTQLGRASGLTFGAAKVCCDMRRMGKRWTCEALRGQPLCVSQYRRVFCTSRIPGPGRDSIMCYSTQGLSKDEEQSSTCVYTSRLGDPTHIVVMARNRFFKVEVIRYEEVDVDEAVASTVASPMGPNANTGSSVPSPSVEGTLPAPLPVPAASSATRNTEDDGAATEASTKTRTATRKVPRPVPVEELLEAFATIVATVTRPEAKPGVPVGVFTTANRDSWFEAREMLLRTGSENRRSLEAIQSALFVLVLDSASASDGPEEARLILHGPGSNRWFDRHNLIVLPDGTAGWNFEHAVGDGAVTLNVADTMFNTDMVVCPSAEDVAAAEAKATSDVSARVAAAAAKAAQHHHQHHQHQTSGSPAKPSASGARVPSPDVETPNRGAKSQHADPSGALVDLAPETTPPKSPPKDLSSILAERERTREEEMQERERQQRAILGSPPVDRGVEHEHHLPHHVGERHDRLGERTHVAESPTNASGPVMSELFWRITPEIAQRLTEAHSDFVQLAQGNETVTLDFDRFSSDFIKRAKMSPDAFVQLAFQLTHYRLFGRHHATYEAASTRAFLHGRTEVVRSATRASADFCEAANRPVLSRRINSKVPTQMELLRSAAEAHVDFMKLAKNGRGVDRHLLALRRLCVENGLPMPAVFTDVVFEFSSRWVMSTSHCGSNALRFFGFGPVVVDGFGIGYMIKQDTMSFVITSKYQHCLNSSQIFAKMLESSLLQMQAIVESDWETRRQKKPPPLAFTHPTLAEFTFEPSRQHGHHHGHGHGHHGHHHHGTGNLSQQVSSHGFGYGVRHHSLEDLTATGSRTGTGTHTPTAEGGLTPVMSGADFDDMARLLSRASTGSPRLPLDPTPAVSDLSPPPAPGV